MIQTIKTCDRCGAVQRSGESSKSDIRTVAVIAPSGDVAADVNYELCAECVNAVARAARDAIRKSAIDKTLPL